MQRIEELKKLNEEIVKKLEAYERTDPKKVQDLIKNSNQSKSAANRWTENIFTIKDWMKDKNPNFTNSILESRFSILKNLDELD